MSVEGESMGKGMSIRKMCKRSWKLKAISKEN
jgi:hypothetical protein